MTIASYMRQLSMSGRSLVDGCLDDTPLAAGRRATLEDEEEAARRARAPARLVLAASPSASGDGMPWKPRLTQAANRDPQHCEQLINGILGVTQLGDGSTLLWSIFSDG